MRAYLALVAPISIALMSVSMALIAGCANTVTLEVAFPNEGAVLISSSAEITMVRIEGDSLNVCPRLLSSGSTLSFYEASVPICDLRSSPIPDPGAGAFAVLVRVSDSASSVILEGCAVGEVFPGRGPLVVDLFPTDGYAASAAASMPLPGTTLSSLCGGR